MECGVCKRTRIPILDDDGTATFDDEENPITEPVTVAHVKKCSSQNQSAQTSETDLKVIPGGISCGTCESRHDTRADIKACGIKWGQKTKRVVLRDAITHEVNQKRDEPYRVMFKGKRYEVTSADRAGVTLKTGSAGGTTVRYHEIDLINAA